MATITHAQIAVLLKAAEPLEKLPPDIEKIVKGKDLLGDLHDLDVTTASSVFEGLVKRVASSVKQAKELLANVKKLEDAEDSITYANAAVKNLCKADHKKKLISIQLAGTSEIGHGKVPFLDDALHAHVTHTVSVAWKWRSGKVHVVAVGTKNPKNPTQDGKKTMSYDWTTK